MQPTEPTKISEFMAMWLGVAHWKSLHVNLTIFSSYTHVFGQKQYVWSMYAKFTRHKWMMLSYNCCNMPQTWIRSCSTNSRLSLSLHLLHLQMIEQWLHTFSCDHDTQTCGFDRLFRSDMPHPIQEISLFSSGRCCDKIILESFGRLCVYMCFLQETVVTFFYYK